MGKDGKKQKKDTGNSKRRKRDEDFEEESMDDEIDVFHKQREIIPLDVNDDLDASDEDDEQPVFDLRGGSDEEEDDDAELTGLAAKISRQQKFLREKMGGVEDDMHDEEEEEEDDKNEAIWGRYKHLYYGADNVDYEIQSSDEDLHVEEEEVLRLQKVKAKSLSEADFEQDESDSDSDKQQKLVDILPKTGKRTEALADKEAKDEADYEIKKDLSALSREEQMEVVYSSAPELVGLLSDLNDALDQLEGKVNPLLKKGKENNKDTVKGCMRYLEVKQVLLLAYSQAICFYLLLKSEGHSVRDHPVITRLVEIKNLMEKMKQLDDNLPSAIEDILNQDHWDESETKLFKPNAALTSEPSRKEDVSLSVPTKNSIALRDQATTELVKMDKSKDRESKQEKPKHQNDRVNLQSLEMLKLRASLEEKLKQKGVLSSLANKMDGTKKRIAQPVNRQFETLDDFDDEIVDKDVENGHATSMRSIRQLANTKASKAKFKTASGDVDLPTRDDIGERRRKHELRVLAKAGVKSNDDDVDEFEAARRTGDESAEEEGGEDGEMEESGDEFYREVKRQRIAKLSAKAEQYARKAAIPAPEEPGHVDGKRLISYQMEKNRGLTRNRKKQTKNPRKKYQLKHHKAVIRRKGQVRDIRKPTGTYGGEASGINAGISRSVRFKS
ncbi:hypothetical protein Sjap_006614 [Stephania japonica]|uniref:Sas10 C-terminal domain-containing protein n=1 Tax=Stephania japonica TaxID=461633 RepID=A0AAP0PMZ4_9MAGN